MNYAYPETMTSGWMTLSSAYLISTANDMGKYLQFYLGRLAENIGRKLSGTKTVDIDSGAYMTTHIVLDAIMLVIVAAGVLSLVFLKKSIKNRNFTVVRLIGFVLLHLVLPTFLLLVPTLLGATLWIGARFAPDLFAVLVFGSFVLYLTGTCKIIFWFLHRKKTMANKR